jgi:predicted esterase
MQGSKSARRASWLGAALLLWGGAGEAAKKSEEATSPGVLEVPHQGPSYYVPPRAKGGKKPVLVWLHGRGGNPESDCRKWAKVTADLGWLLCPSGPENRGGGGRGWNNSWPSAKQAVDAAVEAFHEKFGEKIQRKDHILIGFSEGALAAMNIGVREPERFSRWLILAANDVYWGAEGLGELRKSKKKFKKIYLLTGEKDMVVENTRRVYEHIQQEQIKVRIWTPEDIGHEVPGDRMRTFYRRPLRWLLAKK